MALNNLGNALKALSERTGDTTTLAEAVQAFRYAVAAFPADHPDHAGFLNNLGSALQRQHQSHRPCPPQRYPPTPRQISR